MNSNDALFLKKYISNLNSLKINFSLIFPELFLKPKLVLNRQKKVHCILKRIYMKENDKQFLKKKGY